MYTKLPTMNSSNDTAESFSAHLYTSTRIFLGLTFFVAIVVGTLGNSVLCFLVYHQAAMRSPINLLLATVALTDALISLICIPFDMTTVITNEWMLGETFCTIHAYLLAVLSTENFILLTMISVDRYLIIVKRRDELVTGYVPLLLVGSVCLALVICCPPLFGWGHYSFGQEQTHCSLLSVQYSDKGTYGAVYFGILFLLPCLLLLISYFNIVQAVRRSAVRIGDLQLFNRPTFNEKKRNRTLRLDFQFKIRTFSTIFYLFLGIMVCRTPIAVVHIMWATRNTKYCVNQAWMPCLQYCNSVINPIIYMHKIPKYRRAIKQNVLEIEKKLCCNNRLQRKFNAADVYRVSYAPSSNS